MLTNIIIIHFGPGGPPIGMGPPGGWTPTPRPHPTSSCTPGVNILGPNYAQKLQTSSKRPKLTKLDQISLHTAYITWFLGGGPSWAVIFIETKNVHILPIFLLSKVDLPPKCPKKNFYFIKLAILVKFGCYPVIFRLENIILISMLRLKNVYFPISWVLGSRFSPNFKQVAKLFL